MLRLAAPESHSEILAVQGVEEGNLILGEPEGACGHVRCQVARVAGAWDGQHVRAEARARPQRKGLSPDVGAAMASLPRQVGCCARLLIPRNDLRRPFIVLPEYGHCRPRQLRCCAWKITRRTAPTGTPS